MAGFLKVFCFECQQSFGEKVAIFQKEIMQNFVGLTANFVESWEKIRNIANFEGGGSGIFVAAGL